MRDKIFDNFPELEIENYVLRELSTKDSADYYRYLANKHVNEFVSDDDIPSNIEAAKSDLMYWSSLFYHKRCIYWGIAERSKNKLIGTCGFNNWNKTHSRGEISYDLDYNYWRKGIMSKAIAKICNFAFDKMGMLRIQGTVASDNIASIKVLERNGFVKEGLLRRYGILHDESKDFYMYSLVKDTI